MMYWYMGSVSALECQWCNILTFYLRYLHFIPKCTNFTIIIPLTVVPAYTNILTGDVILTNNSLILQHYYIIL